MKSVAFHHLRAVSRSYHSPECHVGKQTMVMESRLPNIRCLHSGKSILAMSQLRGFTSDKDKRGTESTDNFKCDFSVLREIAFIVAPTFKALAKLLIN